MSADQQSHFSISNPPSPEQFGGAKRIDVRPRLPGVRTGGSDVNDDVGVLHFSCPACLTMLNSLRGQALTSVTCANCSASVLPPQLVTAAATNGQGKTLLPPPKKSGVTALKH